MTNTTKKTLALICSTALLLALIAALSLSDPYFSATAEPPSPPAWDYRAEEEQHARVLDAFLPEATEPAEDGYPGVISYEDPQALGKDYVPEGAVCTALEVIGDAVYVDYRLGETRCTDAYFRDGTIEKTMRHGEDKYIYAGSSKTREIEVLNLEKRGLRK